MPLRSNIFSNSGQCQKIYNYFLNKGDIIGDGIICFGVIS
jgi:hypothetical protein